MKRLIDSKRGVSPVIGVVLMVAVVVILAAVIGAFVLGLGGDQQSTPQASFSIDTDGNVIYEGGDSISPSNIEVTASGSEGNLGGGSASDPITAGETVATGATDVGTVRVVYNGNGQSNTIWQTDT